MAASPKEARRETKEAKEKIRARAKECHRHLSHMCSFRATATTAAYGAIRQKIVEETGNGVEKMPWTSML